MGGSGSGACGEREEQLMPQSPERQGLIRRDLLRWRLVGASVVILGSGHSGHAGEMSMPGVERKVLKEVDANIPGSANIRIRDVIFQPGASTPVMTLGFSSPSSSAVSWRRSPPRHSRERNLHGRTGLHGWSDAD
jgi:hypothetical protein